MVGTRLGHLRGLMERKSHAPCLLLPTVVPSFDCESMNNAWRMGLKEEGGWRDCGGGGGGTSTLKGPCHSGSHYRWTTTLMSHGERKKSERKQKERWGLNGKEKQTSYKKQKGFHEIKHCQHFKQAAYRVFFLLCFHHSADVLLLFSSIHSSINNSNHGKTQHLGCLHFLPSLF